MLRDAGNRTLRGHGGFTLIEILFAMVVLLVGVLGTVAMIDGANRTTSMTRAREGATNVSRDVIESARTIPFAALDQANVQATLQAQPGLADESAAAGWQVVRRGTTYTISIATCTVDDAKDGIGSHAAGGFCSNPTVTSPADANPLDLKRVVVTVDWNDERGAQQTKQTSLIVSSDRGPSLSTLATSPTAGAQTITSGTTVNFAATTSAAPAGGVEWYLDGSYMANATGSGTSWGFSWALGSPPGSPLTGTTCDPANTGAMDGNYFVSAKAYDAAGVSAGPRVLTMSLNRCPPLAPTGLQAGRDGTWGMVELQWDANKEEDVAGYYVYRVQGAIGSSSFKRITPGDPTGTTCAGLVLDPTCYEPDTESNTGKQLNYRIVAVDRDSSGNLRESTQSAYVTALTSNTKPGTPTLSSGGTSTTLSWNATNDSDSGDYVDFYRVYRDCKTSISCRYDVVDNVGSPVTYTDGNPGTGSHTYYVTAVDNHLLESSFSNGVTR